MSNNVLLLVSETNNRTVADRRAALGQRHLAQSHPDAVRRRAAPSANNNRAGPVLPVGLVVRLCHFHFWHCVRPAGR